MNSMNIILAELERMNCEMIHAYHARVLKQHTHLWQRVRCCVVWYIDQGSVDFLDEFGQHEVIEAGNWVFQMPDAQVNRAFSTDAIIISLRFRAHWENGRPLFGEANWKWMPDEQLPGLKKAAKDYLASVPWETKKQYNLMVRDTIMPVRDFWGIHANRYLFFELWYEAALKMGFKPQAPNTKEPRINQALAIIRDAIGQTNVPYKQITYHTKVSRAHIDRLFDEYLNTTPKAEHDRIRVEIAQDRIRQTHLPIKNIAFELGFRDASQFARWFKRLVGQNPNEVRRVGDRAE